MTEKHLLWNRFIEEICDRDVENLSEIQRTAVLCFWYDAEMNSGGYGSYMDCYPDTDPEELEKAILTVGGKELADNYRKAVSEGEDDDWAETDNAYYDFSPSLCDCLQEYVEKNKTAIFD
ncbi:MAG: DMP19 family protein [Ruminococcaceae bacterium]|nr:DMP19 family protein [Oscillospiraceae bacterium]